MEDKLTNCVMGCVGVLLVGLVIFLIALGIDGYTAKSVAYHATVAGRNFTPAYTDYIYVDNGNGGLTMILEFHPNSWDLRVKTIRGHEWAACTEDDYDNVPDGTEGCTVVSTGCIFEYGGRWRQGEKR